MNYKNHKLEYVKNVSEENLVVDFLIFGQIGREVDGNLFAHEMGMFRGFQEIRININSVGGSVIQGNSIMGAMAIARMNGTKITTINRGVADSMAGMILANGDKGSRIGLDFSTGVIHEPLAVNAETGKAQKIDEVEDDSLKEELLIIKDSLLTMLSGNTGKNKDELAEIMKTDKRRSVIELKKFGLVDSIEITDNKPNISNSMSDIELMAACTNHNNQKLKDMNLVTKILNLKEDANEKSIVASIEDLQNKSDRVDELETQLQGKVDEITNKDQTIETLQAQVKESKKVEIEALVDSAIESGKFSKDKREQLIVDATESPELFKNIISNLTVPHVDVTEMIDNSTVKGDDKELRMAKEYFESDKLGNLPELENKLGEEKFIQYEIAYTDRINDL